MDQQKLTGQLFGEKWDVEENSEENIQNELWKRKLMETIKRTEKWFKKKKVYSVKVQQSCNWTL